MKLDEKILSRLNELIDMGQRVLSTRHGLPPNHAGDDRVDKELTAQWVTSVQNILCRVFGKDSIHLDNVNKIANNYITYSPALRIQGILKAATDDYKNNCLLDIKTLIEAEVFDDFLEQAEYLLDAGYYQPSAVIVGAVLEDSLRKLCLKNEIEIEDKPKMDKMNADLAKLGIYNKLVQKQITAFADLRNKAAHGKWDEFSNEEVKGFIFWVRSFMSNHF